MRFSLWKLLVLVALLGAAIGLYARTASAPYQSDGGGLYQTTQGSMYSQTRMYVDKQLVCWVIVPATANLVVSGGLGPPGTADIDFSRRYGVFLNGKPFKLDAVVYVATRDKTLRPVPLTEEELEQVFNVSSTVWRQKIEPVIDEEYERGRLASAGIADASTSR